MLNMYKDLDSAQFCRKTLTSNIDYTNKNAFHFLKNTFSDFPQKFSHNSDCFHRFLGRIQKQFIVTFV